MFDCGRFKLGDLCRHRPVGDLAAQPPAAVPNVRFYVDHVVRGDGNVNFADAAERIGKLISANPALAQVYLKPHELRAMFDLAADFRNVAERNPRIGQLPVSSVPILPHVLDGLMEAPWATAGYVPGEGGRYP